MQGCNDGGPQGFAVHAPLQAAHFSSLLLQQSEGSQLQPGPLQHCSMVTSVQDAPLGQLAAGAEGCQLQQQPVHMSESAAVAGGTIT